MTKSNTEEKGETVKEVSTIRRYSGTSLPCVDKPNSKKFGCGSRVVWTLDQRRVWYLPQPAHASHRWSPEAHGQDRHTEQQEADV